VKIRGVNGYSALRKSESPRDTFEGTLKSGNFENSFGPFKTNPIS
jgi:hypothetical protein